MSAAEGGPLQRVLIVGTSASGKTTLARRLASALGAPHVELDALHWLPGWRERPREEFRDLVARAIAPDRWVTCGNYTSQVSDLTWARATDVVWLDYRFPVVAWRALSRTARRVVTGEECCNGNRESLGKALFSRESILWWVLTSHGRNARRYPARLADPANAHVRAHRLRSPAETERWVGAFEAR